ncbi:MAG: quinone-dependent dihydroorotate dehydrogenase [Candidatus Woesearchaeota archaeon]
MRNSNNSLVSVRNSILRTGYKTVIKPVFFRRDPEDVHDRMIRLGSSLGRRALGRRITKAMFYYHNDILVQEYFGIRFNNPIGLAAGFDKNAELIDILSSVGFGYAEIGSVTGQYCQGNNRPRLWRLPNDESLIVNYGLKNDGALIIRERIGIANRSIPIGISIAKTNNKETADMMKGIEDYKKAYDTILEVSDYITINISCPNAYGGEPFQDPQRLDMLLSHLNITTEKPVFIKLPHNLNDNDLELIIGIARKHHIAGFVCTNLHKNSISSKPKGASGGVSGRILREDSDNTIRRLYAMTRGEFIIIGVGGIFSAEDAYRKIRLGASLLQMITGMIYNGPAIISEINMGLSKMLIKDGYTNISQAVGIDAYRGDMIG